MGYKALLVIELQNDFLWEKRRAKFPYDTEKLTAAVNGAIEQAQAAGTDVIYLSQIFPDTPTNHLVFGYCIEKTEGAELWSGLHVVSDYCFEKNTADPFLSPGFAALVQERAYEELLLCGIDEYGSISGAAKAAVQHGIRAAVLKDCVASRFPVSKLIPLRRELKQLGIEYL
ncbi:MAG: cysteine hydrolase [Oscillospiraceae bacterium]|nr:cysteine hydrolase [Oscillospiraceae bacterium]